MKKTANLLLITLLSIAAVSCSSINSGDTFLWRVDSENTHIYLLGSIHIGTSSMYPLDSKITMAYEDSRSVAFEVDMSSVDPVEMMKHISYTDGTMLKDKISKESYSKLKAVFDKYDMPEVTYSTMKPWIAAVTAQQLIMSQEGDYSSYDGIDQHFMKLANNDGKDIYSLETIEYQIGLFEKFGEMADSFVQFTIDNSKNTVSDVDKMVSAWKEGNKEELMKFINDSKGEYPEFESIFEELIDVRNDNMTKKVEEWLTGDEVIFVVVGAGHLIGENGIINQLDKTGKYSIKNY